MLYSHIRQIDTTAVERAGQKKKTEQLKGDQTEVPPWDGQQCNHWGLQLVCG